MDQLSEYAGDDDVLL